MPSDLAAHVEADKQELRAALVSSADPRHHALGLFLQSPAFKLPLNSDNIAALNELAEMAASSPDPGVYAIALQACRESGRSAIDGSCADISAHGWSQIEPDNMVPWLMLAGEAGQRKDAIAQAEAMHQAAVATHLESYTDTLVAEAVPAMPSNLRSLEQVYLYGDLMAIQGAISFPYEPRSLRDCSIAETGEAASLKDCAAVAEHMVSAGQTLLDLVVGTRLGEKAGWSAERVAGLKRERSALLALAQNGSRQFLVKDSCHEAIQAMERQREWFALDELAALRAELQVSGLTVDELLAQYDEGKARLQSEARAAATSAPR